MHINVLICTYDASWIQEEDPKKKRYLLIALCTYNSCTTHLRYNLHYMYKYRYIEVIPILQFVYILSSNKTIIIVYT